MRTALGSILVAVLAVSAAGGAAHAKAKAKRGPPLLVKRFVPKHLSKSVPIYGEFKVVFNRAIDLRTVTAQTAQIRKIGGAAVSRDLRFDSRGKILVMTPRTALDRASEYEVVVRPGLLGVKGVRTLREERRADFFTDTRPAEALAIRWQHFEALPATMSEPRAGHTATTLPDGRVLLAAGLTDYTRYAVGGDVFDPATNTFTSAGGALGASRSRHAAVGRGTEVLLVGGANGGGALASTETYDPASMTFLAGPSLLETRDYVAALALPDGRALVVGGLRYEGKKAIYSATAEILDPAAAAFRPTTSAPLAPRAGHTLTLLGDGRVLVVGGDSKSSLATAEIFDPQTETFTALPSYPVTRREGMVATWLAGSSLALLTGGMRTPYVFDPADTSFRYVLVTSAAYRVGATASRLLDGSVLIAGGLQPGARTSLALDSMELYVSGGDGSIVTIDPHFREPRYGHTATVLDDGRVLFAGGFGTADSESLSSAEVFTPPSAGK